jgi:hypothetical protein
MNSYLSDLAYFSCKVAQMRRRMEFATGVRVMILTVLFGMSSRPVTAKTIQATPGVPVIAETTWYYVNCTTSAGLGSYSINMAPTHGAVTTADVSGPLPGCPSGSPSLPAVQATYTWTDLNTTDTTDYFELYYILNGQVAAVLDVNVTLSCPSPSDLAEVKSLDSKAVSRRASITTRTSVSSSVSSNAASGQDVCSTPPPPPSVTIFANGTDITGSTLDNPATVVIGEQIVLTSSISNLNGASVQNQNWSIPGNLVKSYGENNTASPFYWTVSPTCSNVDCQPVLLKSSELASDAVTYHWIDAVNACSTQTVNEQQVCFRTVTYAATLLSGQSVSAQGTFEVLQPAPTYPSQPLLTWNIGSAHVIDLFEQTLNLTDALGPFAYGQGMVITPNLTAPPGFPGSTYLLQVGSSQSIQIHSSGRAVTCDYAYAFDQLYSPVQIPEKDSPGSPLPNSLTELSLSDSFQTYLLWEPDLPNSIPAPLGILPWYFNASAKRESFGLFFNRWHLQAGSAQGAGPFQATTTYPLPWTNFLKNRNPPDYSCHH